MTTPNALPQIILASTSPFRKQLLEKLKMPFETANPKVDEVVIPGEAVADMVQRLALQKAQALSDQYPNAIVIGSDQSASFEGNPIGKPQSHTKATEQLRQLSGHTVDFYTGLAVINTATNQSHLSLDLTRVTFRQLTKAEIEHYLRLEEPYQCAGSFKSEGLGITLFEKIESTDPNALIGLPLIALTSALKQFGIAIPYPYTTQQSS